MTFYSEKLQLNIKYEPDKQCYKVQDKKDPLFRTNNDYWMRYTLKEAEIMKNNGGMDKEIHKLKKFFDGEIVEDEELTFYNKGKCWYGKLNIKE